MGGGRGGGAGEILTLAHLIGEHVQAFDYDWRTRFGLPVEAIFDGRMSWREAWSLTQTLTADTSSHVFAALVDWEQPWGRELFMLADLIDVQRRRGTRKGAQFKPYPRPTDRRATRSAAPVVSQAVLRAELAKRGPAKQTPVEGQKPA